jgi:hypothetical protein
VGDPDAGASALYARGDHVHGIERGATVGSPTYNSAPYFNTDHHLFGVRANGLYRPLQLLTYVDDDFMTGATSVGFAGREGWTTTAFAAGGSVALVGLSGHPGICKINNQTVSNGGARVRLGDNADNWVLAGDEWFAALIKISGTASSASKFMVGLGNAPASSAADTNAIGFQDNNSTAMRGFCMAASSQSNTGTTFSYSGDTWYWLVAKMNLSLITFYILDNDGDTLWNDTVSTNIPTGDASPTLRFWTTNSTTRDMSVDYFGMGGGIGRSFWRKS